MFMCVCSTFGPSDFFYYSSKTDSWGRSLKVTAPAETNPPAVALTPRSNNTSCYYEYSIVSVAWMTKALKTVYIELNGGM